VLLVTPELSALVLTMHKTLALTAQSDERTIRTGLAGPGLRTQCGSVGQQPKKLAVNAKVTLMIAVTSGKGRGGKFKTACNLALALALKAIGLRTATAC
jgi:Mrp family chromosome partitioning ATPase